MSELTKETPGSITDWAKEIFGEVNSNLSIAVRANEELAELMGELSKDDKSPKAAAEIADVFIILYRLCIRLDIDIFAEIDKKMAINRSRTWAKDGNGHGRHVKSLEKPPGSHDTP